MHYFSPEYVITCLSSGVLIKSLRPFFFALVIWSPCLQASCHVMPFFHRQLCICQVSKKILSQRSESCHVEVDVSFSVPLGINSLSIYGNHIFPSAFPLFIICFLSSTYIFIIWYFLHLKCCSQIGFDYEADMPQVRSIFFSSNYIYSFSSQFYSLPLSLSVSLLLSHSLFLPHSLSVCLCACVLLSPWSSLMYPSLLNSRFWSCS